MNDEKFTLKARRATRIPLRIPVVLTGQERDRTRSCDAWTMIVNIHGARIECRGPFEEGEEVLIQVPFSGKAQKGKIVWRTPEVNQSGNFELGVELESPRDLWGVGFPFPDWNANRSVDTAETTAPGRMQAASETAPLKCHPSPNQAQSPVEVPVQKEAATTAGKPTLPRQAGALAWSSGAGKDSSRERSR